MLELVLYGIRLLASRLLVLGTVRDIEWRILPLDQGGGEVLHVRFFDDDCKEQSRAILVAYASHFICHNDTVKGTQFSESGGYHLLMRVLHSVARNG